MAIIRSLRVSLSAVVTKFTRGMGEAKKELTSFQRAVQNVNRAATFGKLAVGMRATTEGLRLVRGLVAAWKGDTDDLLRAIDKLPFGIGRAGKELREILRITLGIGQAIEDAQKALEEAQMAEKKAAERLRESQKRAEAIEGLILAADRAARLAAASEQERPFKQLRLEMIDKKLAAMDLAETEHQLKRALDAIDAEYQARLKVLQEQAAAQQAKLAEMAARAAAEQEERRINALRQAADRITAAMRTPLEKFEHAMDELQELLGEGLISEETFDRAAKRFRAEMEKAMPGAELPRGNAAEVTRFITAETLKDPRNLQLKGNQLLADIELELKKIRREIGEAQAGVNFQ